MTDPIKSNNPNSVFGYQFHQIAIYAAHQDDAVEFYRNLGHNDWIEDYASLVGWLDGELVETQAHMQFNYDIMPMELEFLTYSGPNRHAAQGRDGEVPFISHMSVYTDDVFEIIKQFRMKPYHRFVTRNHANPGVAGKKRFIECIYDTRNVLGYDIKFIQKVPWDFPDDMWLSLNLDDAFTFPTDAEKFAAFFN